MTLFLAIRHAESTMNAEGLWQGQADPPLSPQGRQQAAELAPVLRGRGLTDLVSSDLRRARETAEIVAELLGLGLRTDPGLREADVGSWSGRPHDEIRAAWPEDYARVRAGDWEVRPGGGERRRDVRVRAQEAVARACREATGPLAIVTHMGVLRALQPGLVMPNAGTVELHVSDLMGPVPAADPATGADRLAEAPAEGPL